MKTAIYCLAMLLFGLMTAYASSAYSNGLADQEIDLLRDQLDQANERVAYFKSVRHLPDPSLGVVIGRCPKGRAALVEAREVYVHVERQDGKLVLERCKHGVVR